MSNFTIYPAIDLLEGRVVRLAQGDPDRETDYGAQPLAVARRWQAAGATWLHVVNLDGAFGEGASPELVEGERKNVTALARILTTGMQVQFGGGVRALETVRRVLGMGVSRVVLGTVAVENPSVVEAALADFGSERLAVGIDARDGYVRTRGWREAAPLQAVELAQQWAALGGRWLIFTDIARDGMSSGVNVEATAALAQATGLSVIASGGVATLDDVQRVKDAGLQGVIIGRALYDGCLDLEAALKI